MCDENRNGRLSQSQNRFLGGKNRHKGGYTRHKGEKHKDVGEYRRITAETDAAMAERLPEPQAITTAIENPLTLFPQNGREAKQGLSFDRSGKRKSFPELLISNVDLKGLPEMAS